MATKIEPIFQVLNKYPYEVKKEKSTKKKQVLIFKSSNRALLQKDIEKDLDKKKIEYTRKKDSALSGSQEVTVVPNPTNVYKDATVVLVFKPASGGMSETTLNSTITELAPALAFVNKIKVRTIEELYDKLKQVKHKGSSVYVVPRDEVAGEKFINDFPKSSKFKTKMENALGVLDWLYAEDKKNPIETVIWGYRAKPQGVDPKHKGDLFVRYKTGKMLGVSLKAGDENSKEPKLNTYVKPILEKINPNMIESLRVELFEKIYNKFSTSEQGYDRIAKKQTTIKLAELEKQDPKEYNSLYDTGLDIIRKALTQSFEKDVKTTVDYLRTAIVGDAGEVPLLVLKAYNKSVKVLTDEDDVAVFLPKVTRVSSWPSDTSKQDFYIQLYAKSTQERLIMKFAVRTNKTGDEHKLGQFFNLAVKFNGIV